MPPELKTKIKDMTKVTDADYSDHLLIDSAIKGCRTIDYENFCKNLIRKFNKINEPSGDEVKGFKTEFEQVISDYTTSLIRDRVRSYLESHSGFKYSVFQYVIDSISSDNYSSKEKLRESLVRGLNEYTDSTPDSVDSILMYDDDRPYLKRMPYSKYPFLFGITGSSDALTFRATTQVTQNKDRITLNYNHRTSEKEITITSYYYTKVSITSQLHQKIVTFDARKTAETEIFVLTVGSSDNYKYVFLDLTIDFAFSVGGTEYGKYVIIARSNVDFTYSSNHFVLYRLSGTNLKISNISPLFSGWYQIRMTNSNVPILRKV